MAAFFGNEWDRSSNSSVFGKTVWFSIFIFFHHCCYLSKNKRGEMKQPFFFFFFLAVILCNNSEKTSSLCPRLLRSGLSQRWWCFFSCSSFSLSFASPSYVIQLLTPTMGAEGVATFAWEEGGKFFSYFDLHTAGEEPDPKQRIQFLRYCGCVIREKRCRAMAM